MSGLGRSFRIAFTAVLLLGTLPRASFGDSRRSAVIVVGADAAAAGSLQIRLEGFIGESSEVELVPRDELASRLQAKRPQPVVDETLATLLLQAKEAYFDDRIAEASERIESARRMVDAGLGRPHADRVTVLAWRTALALAKDDRPRAEEAARALLAIAPEFQPDLDIFRPSVGKLFNEVRTKEAKPVEIQVDGLPPGGTLQVDDHFVEGRFRITSGAHRLIARAPGFELGSLTFDRDGLALHLAPALQLDTKDVESIENVVSGDAHAASLVPLARSLGVDTLVTVVIHRDGSIRAAIAERNGTLSKSAVVPKDGVSDLARWLVTSLGSAVPTRLRVGASAQTAFASRAVSVDFKNGKGFQTRLGGAGVGAEAVVEYGTSRALLSVSSLSYQRSSATFQTKNADYEVDGGASVDVRGWGSHAFPIRGFALRPSAGVRFESDTSGGPQSFAVFPAYTRTDAMLGAGAETRVRSFAFSVSGYATQNLFWKSRNGWTHATVPLGFGWSGSAVWERGSWMTSLDYRGESRESRFSGSYPISASEPLDDPHVSESVQVVSFSVGYRLCTSGTTAWIPSSGGRPFGRRRRTACQLLCARS